MATPARKILTPEQRDRVSVLLFQELQVWSRTFGTDLIRSILDDIERRDRTPEPDPQPPATAVLQFPTHTTTRAVAAVEP